MKITKEAFYNLIQIERNAQDEKGGEQNHSNERWFAISGEEFGEIAKAVVENDDIDLLPEIVQALAAVLENWVTPIAVRTGRYKEPICQDFIRDNAIKTFDNLLAVAKVLGGSEPF